MMKQHVTYGPDSIKMDRAAGGLIINFARQIVEEAIENRSNGTLPG